jgi:hypothetical protein
MLLHCFLAWRSEDSGDVRPRFEVPCEYKLFVYLRRDDCFSFGKYMISVNRISVAKMYQCSAASPMKSFTTW